MSSYRKRKFHYEDITILWPSYIHNGISYTGKTISLYWFRALVVTLTLLFEWVYRIHTYHMACKYSISLNGKYISHRAGKEWLRSDRLTWDKHCNHYNKVLKDVSIKLVHRTNIMWLVVTFSRANFGTTDALLLSLSGNHLSYCQD